METRQSIEQPIFSNFCYKRWVCLDKKIYLLLNSFEIRSITNLLSNMTEMGPCYLWDNYVSVRTSLPFFWYDDGNVFAPACLPCLSGHLPLNICFYSRFMQRKNNQSRGQEEKFNWLRSIYPRHEMTPNQNELPPKLFWNVQFLPVHTTPSQHGTRTDWWGAEKICIPASRATTYSCMQCNCTTQLRVVCG